MAKSYGSKQEMEKEGSNFTALKAGSYIAKLTKNVVQEKKDFNGNLVPTLCLQFSPYEANARTAVIKDVDGNTVKPLARKLFQDINKVTMGFRENFTIPSKFRALIAALQDMDPNDDVPGPDELTAESAQEMLEEYEGNYVVVNIIVTEKNGNKRNKITDFQPVPEDFEADPVVEAQLADAEKKRAENSKSDSPRSASQSSSEDEDDEEEVEVEEVTTKKSKKSEKKPTRKALF